MKATASITYSVTTEESAQAGEHSEHGWWLPGGYEFPLDCEDGYQEDTLKAAQDGDFDLPIGQAIREAINLELQEIEVNGNSLTARSVDPPVDRAYLEKGESREYTLHIDGCTNGTIKRIVYLLKNQG